MGYDLYLANENWYVFFQSVMGNYKDIDEYILNDLRYTNIKEVFKIKSGVIPIDVR